MVSSGALYVKYDAWFSFSLCHIHKHTLTHNASGRDTGLKGQETGSTLSRHEGQLAQRNEIKSIRSAQQR